MTRYKWTLLGLLTAFWGLVGVNRLGITVVLPSIAKEFHTSQFQLALLITGTSVTWAISSWGSGWLADRFGRKKILIPGAIAAVGFTAAMGAAWNWLSLFVIRDLIGIGDGVGWPSGQSTIAEEVPAERRALASGIFTAGYPFIGGVVGSVVIGALITGLGWRPVFPILSIVFLGVIVALWAVMREPKRKAAPARLDWRNAIRMVRNRNVVFLMLIQAGALGWLQVGVLFNAQWLEKIHGLSPLGAGAILSISSGVGVVGTLLLPALSDFLGRKPLMVGGGVLCALMLGIYLYAGLPLGPAAVFLALNSFFSAVIIPLGSATCIVEMVDEEVRAATMGIVNFAGVVIGTLIVPLIAGAVADAAGMRAGFTIAVVTVALSGLLALGIPETAPRVLARRRPEPATAQA